jgi:GNAT superfamily N-acetyltransferase
MNVGRYDFLLYERDLEQVGGEPNIELRVVQHVSELADLAALGVLPDHARWFQRGSLCVWTPAEDGSPGSLLWWHLTEHVDHYLGRWSKPNTLIAYENGVMTRQDLRGKGLGRRLVGECPKIVAALGYETARSAIEPSNDASIRIHNAAGYVAKGRARGVRLGPFHLQRTVMA